MSVYGINESAVFGGPTLNAANGYHGINGAYDILAENAINDLMIFEGVIGTDFNEVKLVRESAGAEAIEALYESAGSDLIDKIKGFVTKAFEKIKGLIVSFLTRLQSVVIRDNKKLVETHRKKIYEGDHSKMKFKWSAVKGNKDAVYPSVVGDATKYIDNIHKLNASKNVDALNSNVGFHQLAEIGSKSDLGDVTTELNSVESKESTLKAVFGTEIKYNNINNSLKEGLFEERDTVEGLSRSLRDNIMTALSESKDVIKGLKDAEKKLDTLYKSNLKKLNKLSDEFAKFAPSGGSIGDAGHKVTGEQAASAIRGTNFMYNQLRVEQELVTKSISGVMHVIKFKVSDARSVFVQAAAFRGVKESGDLDEGGDSTVEINIEIDEDTPEVEPEIIEAIEDESDDIVNEQFGFQY